MPYSIEHTVNNLLINELKEKFSKHVQFTLKEMLDFYRVKEPLTKKTTVQWRVTRLLELSIIQRIGRGKYAIGNYRKFKPYSTRQIKKAYNHLINEFPNAKFCLWSTEWLKIYLPNLEVQIVFIEGLGKEPSYFFFHLWEQRYTSVYYGLPNTVSKMYYNHAVIVRRMISGSPLMESEEIIYPHLEKIIVDLYCDWNKINPHNQPTFYRFLKKLNTDYSINENKLLRYADRRKKKQIFLQMLNRMKN